MLTLRRQFGVFPQALHALRSFIQQPYVTVKQEIRHHFAGLPRTHQVARPAKLQVFLRDDEAIIRLRQDAQSLIFRCQQEAPAFR